jgi:hypothetical protein
MNKHNNRNNVNKINKPDLLPFVCRGDRSLNKQKALTGKDFQRFVASVYIVYETVKRSIDPGRGEQEIEKMEV